MVPRNSVLRCARASALHSCCGWRLTKAKTHPTHVAINASHYSSGQEHLREVRDLTEALTKDESVLINHDLANEPERSVSSRVIPLQQCGTGGIFGGHV